LAPILNVVGNKIAVHGHADPEPVPRNMAFASNWELSLARAAAVAAALHENGLNKSLTVRGFGDSRYASGTTGDAVRDRQLARRVDLVIEAAEADRR
jgi:chemotaxis protein MotB